MLDEKNFELLSSYVDNAGIRRSTERHSIARKKMSNLLTQGRLPEKGFSEAEIECFFLQLASLDSNNWDDISGVGEREGRVLLNCIKRRHYGLTHGIGRSGDITAIQPKATGSSLLNRLTNKLLLDWLRRSGSPSTADCLLVPMATGMSLTLCMLLLKTRRPVGARFVVWPRIDQKSCFKSMLLAGLIPVPIDLTLRPSSPDVEYNDNRDTLFYDPEDLKMAIRQPAAYLREHWPTAAETHGITEKDASQCNEESVVCVLSTTSCFAPRPPDRLSAITRICLEHKVGHLVNNAYGVQSVRYMRMIESAGLLLTSNKTSAVAGAADSGSTPARSRKSTPAVCKEGDSLPIDLLYVQSTDKNLMVPVGGAIIAGFSSELVTAVAKSYPGRASATPSIDVLATLLHMGSSGWSQLCDQRENCFVRLRNGLLRLSAENPRLRLMGTADNRISMAVDLSGLCSTSEGPGGAGSRLTQLGSRLFTQGCSGVRVVLPSSAGTESKELNGYVFSGFGSHSNTSEIAYMNVASAVGQTKDEVDRFLTKLDKALSRYREGDARD